RRFGQRLRSGGCRRTHPPLPRAVAAGEGRLMDPQHPVHSPQADGIDRDERNLGVTLASLDRSAEGRRMSTADRLRLRAPLLLVFVAALAAAALLPVLAYAVVPW